MKSFLASARNGERGLSLTEILVAAAVTSLVVAGAYKVFLYFLSQSLTQRRIAQEQARLLPAQQILEKNLRRAGYGIPLRSQTRNGAGMLTRDAVELGTVAGAPDSLVLRGNFTDVRSQLTVPLTSTSSSTYLNLLKNTAGNFVVGDNVVLVSRDTSEYVRVSGIDAANHRILTDTRLVTNYHAGTTLATIREIRYRYVSADSTLQLIQASGTSTAARRVIDLSFKMLMRDSTVDSVAPYNADMARAIVYTLKFRIPKTKTQYLDRLVGGTILLRSAL